MANEGPPRVLEDSTLELPETSLIMEEPKEISASEPPAQPLSMNTSEENAGICNDLGGDSHVEGKRKQSQLDSHDETPPPPKRAKVAEALEAAAAECETASSSADDTLVVLESDLRSNLFSQPSQQNGESTDSKLVDETGGQDDTNSFTAADDISSGLSSPLSYETSDIVASSQSEHQHITTDEIDQARIMTPPSSVESATETTDMYTEMKARGRSRKQTEQYGAMVATASVVKGEDDADWEDYVEQKEVPQKVSTRVRKQPTETGKRSNHRQSVEKIVRGEKVQHDKRAIETDREKELLGRLTKSTTGVRKSANKEATAKAKSKSKPNTNPKSKPKPKPKPSKEDEKARLQQNGTTSLGKWMLSTATTTSKSKQPLVVTLPLLEIDEDLLMLSTKMKKRENLENKPEPQGKPVVWATTRQSTHETLPYFKSPQSGCYQNDSHVYGFLFDSIGHCREYMDEDVIVCRAGGSMEADNLGGMVQRKDHSVDEAQVKAVLNDMAHHNPIVVICGDRNVAARSRMPHKYCVLGWYKPTLVWSEKTAGKGDRVWTTIKYRLERLNAHLPAWHAPKQPLLSEEEKATIGELVTKTCNVCYSNHPQIYLGGWMCLNDKCTQFWKFQGVIEAPYGTEKCLSYHPAFLSYRSELWNEHRGIELEPAPLRPPIPDIGHAIGDNLTYINTRGICCPKCGRCNSRRFFKGWICENPECDFELSAVHRPVSPAMLHTPWDIAQTLVRNRKQPSVSLNVVHMYGYKLSIYTFHGIPGSFIHASATKPVLQEENGPDDMFANMQTIDMGLERRIFTTKKSSANSKNASLDNAEAEQGVQAADYEEGSEINQDNLDGDAVPNEKKPNFAEGDLMTAFSMNYGMPYKFVASGGSKPFEQGPWPVNEARRRLNWAVKTFLNKPEEDMDLNEELIFAYLESQKLEYHDDGEEGLGPRIATLSLGGKAKMHMRMKTKHYVGCSKSGILVDEKPVAGGLEYEKRLQAWNDLQHLKAADSTAFNKRRKEIPKELGLYEKRTKKAEDLVTVTLSHGDIVIMDGYDIQKYLEHKVVSEGYLRFGLTCRTVLENHLKPEELPNYQVTVDEQTYDGPKI